MDTIHNPQEEIIWEELSQNDAEKILLPLMDKYAASITPAINFLGVEVNAENIVINDLGISISGTLDRVYKDGFDNIGIYEILATHAANTEINAPALIIGANTGKTDKAQRVAKGQISNAKELVLGDGIYQGILEYASKMLHSGMFYGNPKSQICHEKYCPIYGTCFFRK